MTAIDIQAAAPEMNLVRENGRVNLKRASGALYRTSSFRYPYGYGKYVEYCPRTEATTAVVAIQLGGVCGSFMAGVTWEGLRLNSLGAENSEELD